MTTDITIDDIKLYKSEDQTDTTTGGGRMSANVVVSGEINNLFPNISRIDRLQGRIQPRKIFQKVDSDNQAVYSGAHLIVRDHPIDENVSVLIFPTDDHDDRFTDIVAYIESYYQVGIPAGNAGLEYAVSPGATQIVFKIRHYEYTPHYDRDGKLVYTKKMDARWALNISVGDLVALVDPEDAEIVDYVHIQRLERVTEALDQSTERHYYVVEYVIATLAAPMLHSMPAGVVPKRTSADPTWRAYGVCKLSAPASAGEHDLRVHTTRARLAPVVERVVEMADQAFFGPPAIVSGVLVGPPEYQWEIDTAYQIQVSEGVAVIPGMTVYSFPLQQKPAVASTLEIWYVSDGGWYTLSETDGVLSGDGSGSVSADGMVSVSLLAPADPETVIVVLYTRAHHFAQHESVALPPPEDLSGETQAAVAADTAGAEGEIADAPLEPGSAVLEVDSGSGFELLGTDIGGGIFTGSNIDLASLDYDTGSWSVTFADNYDVPVVLRWSYEQRAAQLSRDTHLLGEGWAGQSAGHIEYYLERYPVVETVSVALRFSHQRGSFRVVVDLPADGSGALSGSQTYLRDGEVTITATGTVSAQGLVSIDFSIDGATVGGHISAVSHYDGYVARGVPGEDGLPWLFSTGLDDIIEDSLVLRYFTAGGGPWLARDFGGVLQQVSGMAAMDTGEEEAVVVRIWPPAYGSGVWMMSDTADLAADGSPLEGTRIWISADGKEWSQSAHITGPHSVTGERYLSRFATDGTVYIGVGNSNQDFHNAGISEDLANWSTFHLGSNAGHLDIVYVAAWSLFVVLAADAVRTSADSGETWQEQASALESNMSVMCLVQLGGAPAIMIFRSGAGQNAQYSLDGASWTLVSSGLVGTPVGAVRFAVSAAGSNGVVVVDDTGACRISADGETFSDGASLSGMPLSLASDGGLLLIAAIDDGSLDVSRDGGQSWTNQIPDHQWAHVAYHYMVFAEGAGWLHISVGSDEGGDDMMRPAISPFEILTDPDTGTPVIEVGTFNPDTGRGAITAGEVPTGASAHFFLTDRQVDAVTVFTRGAAPVAAGSFAVGAVDTHGLHRMVWEEPATPGQLVGDGTGTLCRATGVAEIQWGRSIRPETVRMDYAYGFIYRPAYEEINTRALPLSGMVPVVRQNDIVVISEFARAKLTAAIDAADMAIDVDAGGHFPDREITVQVGGEKITGEMAGDTFAVTGRGADGTTAAAHEAGEILELVSRRSEMAPVLGQSGDRLEIVNPLAYAYKADGAIVSSAVIKGDLSAQISDFHSQDMWLQSIWYDSDEWEGSPANGTYNFSDFPLGLTNKGATTERWLLRVTSVDPLLVEVRGEALGVIATDQPTSSAIVPTNPTTGAPYFTLSAAGWGSGWQSGNILRFNTIMAGAPHWIVRVINARASETTDDHVTLESRGDVMA